MGMVATGMAATAATSVTAAAVTSVTAAVICSSVRDWTRRVP